MWGLDWFSRPKPAPGERASRIKTEVALTFRPVGGFGWTQARMENISKSGILLRTQQVVGVGTRIEMKFAPPPNVWEDAKGLVLCRGKIVRVAPSPGSPGRASLAVKILGINPATPTGEW